MAFKVVTFVQELEVELEEERLSRRLLNPSIHTQYDRDIDHLWHQSVRLNANSYLLKRIGRFPFDLFGDTDNLCWVLFAQALQESSVMTVWRLVCDHKGSLTLRNFQKWMLENRRSEAVHDLRKHFDERPLNVANPDAEERVKSMRHSWLGHLARTNEIIEQGKRGRGLFFPSYDDLEKFGHSINSDIQTLSLDSSRLRTYAEYDESVGPVGTDPRTDIERLLDLVVLSSDAFRMPEEQPDFWPHYWDTLTPHQKMKFNEYRVRLGKNVHTHN